MSKNKEIIDVDGYIALAYYFLYLCAVYEKNSGQVDLLVKKRRKKDI